MKFHASLSAASALLFLGIACGSTQTPPSSANDASTEASADADACDAGVTICACRETYSRAVAKYKEALEDPKNLACANNADCTTANNGVCGNVGPYAVVNKSFAQDGRITPHSQLWDCIKDCGSGGGFTPPNIRCGTSGVCTSD